MSQRSASVYNEYRKIIASCCTDVMLQPPNSSWRNYHYNADLEKVLAISSKLQIKLYPQNLPLNPRPRLNTALAITDQQRLQHESPLSARSDRSFNSINSVTTPLTPSTLPSSSGSPSNDHNFVFTPDISPSSSPVELPAPDYSSFLLPSAAKSASLRCNICHTSFSGSEQNQASNLRRHRRTMHDHRSELPCPEENCDKTFTRSDNLRTHRYIFHGLVCPKKGGRRVRTRLEGS